MAKGPAMRTQDFKLEGMPSLLKKLEALPMKISKRILGRAVGAGARYIRDEAKRLCPVKSGELRKSIKAKKKRTLLLRQKYHVATSSRIAHLVEFGTAPHPIPARSRGILRIRGRFAGGSVMHPGSPPRSFLRRAMEEGAPEAIRRITESLRRNLKKAYK